MLKRIGLLSLGVLSLAVGASQAGAQSGSIAYTIYFYSDASHTTQVGVARPQCFNGNITYRVTGSTSNYSEEVEAYYCGEGGPEPL